MKKSATRGTHTSAVEVTNVSPHGFWLWVDGREHFVPFREFPWFAEASIRALTAVERPSAHHLYWPTLDVDLAVESLTHPERFPLVSRAPATPAASRGAGRRTRAQPTARTRAS